MKSYILTAAIIIQIIIAITESGITRSLAELTAFGLIFISFPLLPRRRITPVKSSSVMKQK